MHVMGNIINGDDLLFELPSPWTALLTHSRKARRSRQEMSQQGACIPRQQSGMAVSSLVESSTMSSALQQSSGSSACVSFRVGSFVSLQNISPLWVDAASSWDGCGVGSGRASGSRAGGPQQSQPIVKNKAKILLLCHVRSRMR